MNLKMEKINIFFCLILLVLANLSIAKVAPPSRFDIKKMILDLETTRGENELSVENSNTLYLLKFLNESFGIDEFTAYIQGEVQAKDIISVIEKLIYNEGAWTKKLSEIELEKIKEERETLLKLLKGESISWAWVEKQLGETKVVKNILNDLFQKQFKHTMKLEKAHYGIGGPGPMGYSEQLLRFLLEMSPKEEQSQLNNQLKKMKRHISKIPQSKIIT